MVSDFQIIDFNANEPFQKLWKCLQWNFHHSAKNEYMKQQKFVYAFIHTYILSFGEKSNIEIFQYTGKPKYT